MTTVDLRTRFESEATDIDPGEFVRALAPELVEAHGADAGLGATRLGLAPLTLDVDGARATVALARPDVLNAQTPDTWHALAAVGEELPPGVRVVVVRGEGRSFSAGLDRSLFAPAPGEPGITGLVDLPA